MKIQVEVSLWRTDSEKYIQTSEASGLPASDKLSILKEDDDYRNGNIIRM